MTDAADPVLDGEVDVTFVRVLDAPRELVFELWTNPKHVAKWWGPRHFTIPRCEWDARPGGAIAVTMRAPDGVDYPMTGVFHEVSPPERLVFTAVAEGQDGPLLEALTTAVFEALGEKTRLTLSARGAPLAEVGVAMLKGMEEGWSQSLEKLADVVAQAKG